MSTPSIGDTADTGAESFSSVWSIFSTVLSKTVTKLMPVLSFHYYLTPGKGLVYLLRAIISVYFNTRQLGCVRIS